MWQILINGPGYFDTLYDLPDGETLVGRADSNHVILSGDQVSRRHVRIEVRGNQLYAEDLGSTNGTWVDRDRLEDQRQVRAGETIIVGENSLAVRRKDDSEPAADGARPEGSDEFNGEVLVSRELKDNPFVERFGEAERLSPTDLTRHRGAQPEVQGLALLIRVSEQLTAAASLGEFLERVIDLLVELVRAETAVVLLRDKEDLVPAVVRHPSALEPGELPVSKSILGEVTRKKAALALADAKNDPRFGRRQSVQIYDARQVICAPMMRGDELLGVIYLARPPTDSNGLSELVDVVGAVAHLTAGGLEKWRLKDKSLTDQRVRRALERFHAPAVVERVVSDLQSGTGRIGQFLEPKEVTVLFVDICGFSALAERLAPERVADLLNEFYSRTARVVFSFEGTVDKYIGDKVMAVFGAPYSQKGDASRAVRCALSLRRELGELVKKRPADERYPVRFGINTGNVLAGTIGSTEHLEYTCVGDVVNVAAKLQASARPDQVLITGKTLAALGARFDSVPLGERELSGRSEKVAVFEILDEDQDIHTTPGGPGAKSIFAK